MTIKIAVDQDQVLADLLEEWLNRYNNDYNDNLKKEDIIHWNWSDIVKLECGNKIYDYLDDTDMFENLKVIDDSVEVVKELSNGYEIFIVTAPWNVDNIKPKYKWLQKHFPFVDEKNYVFTRNKSIINADILIDDKPENLLGFKGFRILFDAPHNKTETRLNRVNNWLEIKEILLR